MLTYSIYNSKTPEIKKKLHNFYYYLTITILEILLLLLMKSYWIKYFQIHYLAKVWGQIFFKEINTFIQQGCITFRAVQLIECDY